MTEILSKDDIENIKMLKEYIKKCNSSYARINADIYHNVGQTIIDNDISSKIQQGLFHSTPGRAATASYLKLNRQIVSSVSTFFGFSMYKVAEYCISLTTNESTGVIVNLFVAFVLLAVVSTILEIQEQLIVDRMGGNTNIIEYTEDDINIMKRKT